MTKTNVDGCGYPSLPGEAWNEIMCVHRACNRDPYMHAVRVVRLLAVLINEVRKRVIFFRSSVSIDHTTHAHDDVGDDYSETVISFQSK